MWQRGWIKLSSTGWDSLGKQFSEVALVKKKCRGDFSTAKGKKKYLFLKERIL